MALATLATLHNMYTVLYTTCALPFHFPISSFPISHFPFPVPTFRVTREQDGSLQSVCPLNGCCKEESASYCTKYQRNRKRRSEDVASTGRGVVRASLFRENINRENLRVWTLFRENLHQRKFPAILVLKERTRTSRQFSGNPTLMLAAIRHFVRIIVITSTEVQLSARTCSDIAYIPR